MKTFRLMSALLISISAVSLIGGVHEVAAQDRSNASCQHTGRFEFNGVKPRSADNLPNLNRQVSTLGLFAYKEQCEVKFICYSAGSGASATRNATRACESLKHVFGRTQVDSGVRGNALAMGKVDSWKAAIVVEVVSAPNAAEKVIIELR